jgi:signal recognition particle receptor subunit beta
MDWAILFAGPVGAGKTQAIRTASDIDVVATEAAATDETALLKQNTTVAMDMGLMRLDAGDRIRLLGAPGQDRFDFMWEILLEQSRGLVLLIDHSREGALEDLRFYAQRLVQAANTRWIPWVVGVTHVDHSPDADLRRYRTLLDSFPGPAGIGPVPVVQVDARDRRDVRALLVGLAAMLDMVQRMPLRVSVTATPGT